MAETPLHAFDFLEQTPPDAAVSVVAAVGGDRFLKRQVLNRLCPRDDDDGADVVALAGPTAQWRDVHDELSTVSLFGTGHRRVLVTEADDFVSSFRTQLEDYVEHPSQRSLLILDLASLPSNTRLYKSILKTGLLIACRLPELQRGRGKPVTDVARLKKWLESWATTRHRIRLTHQAGEQLVDLIGWELGLLDQELAKLALFVEDQGSVGADLVRRVVGGWRTQTTWEMLDAAVSGQADDALRQLNELLRAGEPPQALFGSIAWSLRRFAAATRIFQRMEQQPGVRADLGAALVQAGFPHWSQEALRKAQQQLRAISRQRASQLYRWLLEADLALKGSHSSPPRAQLVLEMLILRLARQAAPPPGTRSSPEA